MFCGHLILLRILYNSSCSLGVIIFALSSNPGVVVEDTFFPFFFGFVLHYLTLSSLMFTTLGPIVQRPISTNPGLNFNSGFYTSMFKSRFRVIFSICFGSSIIKLKTKRVKPNFLFKLSDLTSKFSLTLGYLNPDLTNPALFS